MKIDLQYPFSARYKKGYLVNSQGRNTVILFNSSSDRSSVSYARYLMSVSLGRWLSEDEQVDHINNIKDDDRLENYQLLSAKDNLTKRVIANGGRKYVDLQCPVCAIQFTKFHNAVASKETAACSRKCGGIMSSKSSNYKVKKIVLREYRSTQHLLVY